MRATIALMGELATGLSAKELQGTLQRLGRGVCPLCHTQDGLQALTRSAGYLGEFTVPMDCHDPFHVTPKASMMGKS